jgi:hypothetical protein
MRLTVQSGPLRLYPLDPALEKMRWAGYKRAEGLRRLLAAPAQRGGR